ncbi:hypothetical protein [Sinanaerobacter chloroacetimidivorans]|uniref:Uncharacterized protein n=1 Tax=Sinanaerobacter chloroacetimidivorans TaxID=2818044 RepID=A0A8J7VXD8_9FIRM|nr:hypothetical protein [Sinanaerobacter chloroacetimidivorans]MBR0596822.1 hypothetical protein [Sinanaerobacter chloroacetimidivorans]
MKKNIFCILLIICLMLSMSVVSFADTNAETMIPGPQQTVQITYDEYIALMAAANDLTLQEAKALDARDSQVKLAKINKLDPNTVTAASTQYYKASKTFTYSGNSNFKAKSEATIKLVGAGSMYSISDVTAVWTMGSNGVYTWEWHESSAWKSGMTASKVDLGGSGYFTITYNVSAGGGISVPGFSVSGSVGTTITYTSNSMQMSWTWYNPYAN